MMTESNIWDLLNNVNDPEIPVLSVIDLGIVRQVKVTGNAVEVTITPTYSGCPAMHRIESDIRDVLVAQGWSEVKIRTALQPAWTTDWLTESGKKKLKAYGIAPPNNTHAVCHIELFQQDEAVQCPRCGSYHTQLVSRFASTACKALYKCNDCREPFDYFKCH